VAQAITRSIGGDGNNTFVFDPQFGKDTIVEFDTNKDVVQFNHALFANYAVVRSSVQKPAPFRPMIVPFDDLENDEFDRKKCNHYRRIVAYSVPN
jgi:hypothetical protein